MGTMSCTGHGVYLLRRLRQEDVLLNAFYMLLFPRLKRPTSVPFKDVAGKSEVVR